MKTWVCGFGPWMFAAALLALSAEAEAQGGGAHEPTSSSESDERTSRARAAYAEGAAAFEQGRFAQALDRFSFAYEMSPRAELLYNIGASHDRLGQRDLALAAYQDYLEARPDAPNAAYTSARIEVLEREVAEAQAAARAQAEAEAAEAARSDEAAVAPNRAEPVTPEGRRGALRPVGFTLLAVGGAAAIAGVATGVMALGERSDLEDACPDNRCSESSRGDVDRLRRLGRATDVLLFAGGAIAVAGLVLTLVGGGEDEAGAILEPALGGLRLRGRF
ncbi:MAG: tetratricopeptide repeat protein [Myxococcota bacterium]